MKIVADHAQNEIQTGMRGSLRIEAGGKALALVTHNQAGFLLMMLKGEANIAIAMFGSAARAPPKT